MNTGHDTMGLPDDVISYMMTVDGVLDAFVMDLDLSNTIWDVERGVRTTVSTDYKNLGFDFAMERDHRVCIFHNDTYLFGKRSIVKLVSSDGTIMGTSLHPDDFEEYRGRDDVIWISEDFVVFPHIVGKGEESFVLYPVEIPEVSDNVPGCRDVISSHPTLSSDEILKRTFDKPSVPGIYTMVLAFNSDPSSDRR